MEGNFLPESFHRGNLVRGPFLKCQGGNYFQNALGTKLSLCLREGGGHFL